MASLGVVAAAGAVGLVSCFVAGVSAFGKAILFYLCWQLLWLADPNMDGANDMCALRAARRV
jgi:hypothetical protein